MTLTPTGACYDDMREKVDDTGDDTQWSIKYLF